MPAVVPGRIINTQGRAPRHYVEIAARIYEDMEWLHKRLDGGTEQEDDDSEWRPIFYLY